LQISTFTLKEAQVIRYLTVYEILIDIVSKFVAKIWWMRS